ncbi:hypothetical protein AK812_SmicGene47012, partial [Symbiodinium microadriaticum]
LALHRDRGACRCHHQQRDAAGDLLRRCLRLLRCP